MSRHDYRHTRMSKRKAPEMRYDVQGLPIGTAREALKAEIDCVSSIIQHDDGWHLFEGDDLVAVVSHGKLTNRSLVHAINRRHRERQE